jgi:predicted GNAT family N-acyltransferase
MKTDSERADPALRAKRITDANEREAAFEIRKKVFVDEQGVSIEEEMDEHEDAADHIVVYGEDEQPVGAGRIRFIDGIAKLERICVLASHRKYGVGKVIVETLEAIAKEKGFQHAQLNSQTQAAPFYEKLGYRTKSDVVFMDAGIPHVTMIKELSLN